MDYVYTGALAVLNWAHRAAFARGRTLRDDNPCRRHDPVEVAAFCLRRRAKNRRWLARPVA